MSVRQPRIYTIPCDRRGDFLDRWQSTAQPLMETLGFRFVRTWEGTPDPVHRPHCRGCWAPRSG